LRNKEQLQHKGPRGPESAGPVAIATFATIVNPALPWWQSSGWQLSFVAVVLGGNCPRWQLPWWQLSWVAVVQMAVILQPLWAGLL